MAETALHPSEYVLAATAEELGRLRVDLESLERRHTALTEAHHAGHEGFHGRLDEQRRRMDTLSKAQQSLHEQLLDLSARVRVLERARREEISGARPARP